jgi:NAD dependent epimerase/dehydratase
LPNDASGATTSWKDRPVLVTGAGGFIGSHLVSALRERGARVRALVHYNSRNDLGFLQPDAEGIEVVPGDITDLPAVKRAVTGVDVVFHLAALVGIPYSYEHPHQVVAVNTLGTLNLLTSCKDLGVSKMVHTSTSEVYGSALRVPIDEDHPKQPQSPYSASKISADALALSFHLSFELPVAVCRPFNTYGPRQSDRAIIPTLIAQALTRDELTIGNVTPTRDFTYVGDTVEGFIKIAESPKSVGEEINLGTGEEISIRDLVTKINELVGRDLPIRVDERRIRPTNSEVQRLCSDNRKARELVGWRPAVSLSEGLKRTIEWVRASMDMYRPDEYRT